MPLYLLKLVTTNSEQFALVVQAVAEKALPFEVRVPNAETAAALLDSRNGVVTRTASVNDLFADDGEEEWEFESLDALQDKITELLLGRPEITEVIWEIS